MKQKNHFLVGLIAVVLPVVLGDKLLNSVPEWIVNPFEYYLHIPEFFSRILGLCSLCGFIWAIGLFINQGRFGIALKSWVVSVVCKIPVIGDIFRMLGQVVSTLKYTDSFGSFISLNDVNTMAFSPFSNISSRISHIRSYLWLIVLGSALINDLS